MVRYARKCVAFRIAAYNRDWCPGLFEKMAYDMEADKSRAPNN